MKRQRGNNESKESGRGKRARRQEQEEKKPKVTIKDITNRFGSAADISALLRPFLIPDLAQMVMDYVAPWHVMGQCVGCVMDSDQIGTPHEPSMVCAGQGELVTSCKDGLSVLWPSGAFMWTRVEKHAAYDALATYDNYIYYITSNGTLCEYNLADGSERLAYVPGDIFDFIEANEQYVFISNFLEDKTFVLDRKEFKFISFYKFEPVYSFGCTALIDEFLYFLVDGRLLTMDAGSGKVLKSWGFPSDLKIDDSTSPRILIIREDLLLYFQRSRDVHVFSAQDGTPRGTWQLQEPTNGSLAYNGMFLFARGAENKIFVYK